MGLGLLPVAEELRAGKEGATGRAFGFQVPRVGSVEAACGVDGGAALEAGPHPGGRGVGEGVAALARVPARGLVPEDAPALLPPFPGGGQREARDMRLGKKAGGRGREGEGGCSCNEDSPAGGGRCFPPTWCPLDRR